MAIEDNIDSVKQRIKNSCQKIDRDASEITLIAISKTIPAEMIKVAVENGIEHIGENRVQEADKKFEQLGKIATWHLVGHLQTNKVKKALQIFDFIHSVDSYHLAEEISKRVLQFGQTVECLVEVNTSGETTKFGVSPDETLELAKKISFLPGIQIKGLMTIGAFLPDPEEVRPCFKLLKELRDEIQNAGLQNVEMKYLSMGMTNDFEVAIEEGANMIRVGRAIFGERF
ncbi:MAG: YggS family pyridoxal phosphate-dependent enzyme [bacterium]|nr:MAG: YggS family pyridoxal phosphate-dependent enzyme [bacterium]